jgi:hypothetical protein
MTGLSKQDHAWGGVPASINGVQATYIELARIFVVLLGEIMSLSPTRLWDLIG